MRAVPPLRVWSMLNSKEWGWNGVQVDIVATKMWMKESYHCLQNSMACQR